MLHPRLLETLMNAMRVSDAPVSACQFAHIQNEAISNLDFTGTIAPIRSVSSEELISHFFLPKWHIPIWTKLYRRELLGDLRFHETRLGEDNLFSYRILKRCDTISFCPTTLYFQRMHGKNYGPNGISYFAALIALKEDILSDIRASFPHVAPTAQADYLMECVRIYKSIRRERFGIRSAETSGLHNDAPELRSPVVHALRNRTEASLFSHSSLGLLCGEE